MIGFGTGYFWQTGISNEEKVNQIATITNEAIELNLGYKMHIEKVFSERCIELVKKFKYRSIHGLSDIRYPSHEAEEFVPIILRLAHAIDVHTIVLHPDRVDDFAWVTKTFGSLLAYENMDKDKTFGQTLESMHQVFEHAPNARFVLDVNHIYTWDTTMNVSNNFYQAFKDRLAHYHLSGLGSTTHQCLSVTHQDIIFNGIKDDKPVIIESVPEGEWIEPRIEYQYVTRHLKERS